MVSIFFNVKGTEVGRYTRPFVRAPLVQAMICNIHSTGLWSGLVIAFGDIWRKLYCDANATNVQYILKDISTICCGFIIITCWFMSWWRHEMETFYALLALCAGNSPVTGEFPAQRPATRRFDVFFDLRLNKGFSKQSWGWWFETLSRPLWRHCNVINLPTFLRLLQWHWEVFTR